MKTVYATLAAVVLAAGALCQESTVRPFSDEELDALLKQVEHELGAFDRVVAGFVQEKHLAIFKDVVTAKGVMCFMRPDNVRFEITEPFKSVLIAQTKSVGQYEYIDGEWRKLRLGSREAILMVTGQIAAWLQGRFREDEDVYSLSAVERDGRAVIRLTPVPDELAEHIEHVELTLTPERDRIDELVIMEPSGDFTRIAFLSHRMNPALDESVFDSRGPAPSPLPRDDDPNE